MEGGGFGREANRPEGLRSGPSTGAPRRGTAPGCACRRRPTRASRRATRGAATPGSPTTAGRAAASRARGARGGLGAAGTGRKEDVRRGSSGGGALSGGGGPELRPARYGKARRPPPPGTVPSRAKRGLGRRQAGAGAPGVGLRPRRAVHGGLSAPRVREVAPRGERRGRGAPQAPHLCGPARLSPTQTSSAPPSPRPLRGRPG